MTETLNVVGGFLASPGDLGEERRTARRVVDEINHIVGRRGYHVALMGWRTRTLLILRACHGISSA